MKICDKLKSIFKTSKNIEESVITDSKKIFGDITNKELVSLTVDEFKNKCENEKKKLINKIQSLSEEKRQNELNEISKGMKFFKELKLKTKLAGNLTTKYNFAYECFKEYQVELRKSLNRSN